MKRFGIAIGVLLLLGLAGGGVYLLAQKSGVGQWKSYGDPASRAVVSYPASARAEELSGEDRNFKVVLRIREGEQDQEPYLVSMRYEEGLRAAANTTNRPPRDLILASAERALPQRFPEFSKVGEEKLELSGKEAAIITFTYKQPQGELIKQKLLILVRDDDTALYISAQAKERDWQELEQKYFARIFRSLRFE